MCRYFIKLKLEMNSLKVDIYETMQKKICSERSPGGTSEKKLTITVCYSSLPIPYMYIHSQISLNSDLKFSLKITFTRICITVIDKPGEGPLPGSTLHLLFLP